MFNRSLLASGLALLFTATPALSANTDSRWLVRAGASLIVPKSNNGDTAAGNVTIDNRAGPSVDLVYFFTPNWSVDVLGALPFKHDISLDGEEAASAKHLPPVVSLQYHFLPGAQFSPYVGLGLNYTFFFEEKLNGVNADLKLDDSIGAAAQVGIDWNLTPQWVAGADIRWVDIDTDVSLNGNGLGTAHIDPLVYALTLGYRF